MEIEKLTLLVNSIAAIIALIGLVVTCCQFKKTMKAQVQAINVALFDLRMEILGRLEDDNFDFNRTRARFLFNTDIAEEIEKYGNAYSEYKRLRNLKQEFITLIQSNRSDSTYEGMTELLNSIQEYEEMDTDDPQYQQLRSYLHERDWYAKYYNGDFPLEAESNNYIDITDKEKAYLNKAEMAKAEIISRMKQYIALSIPKQKPKGRRMRKNN